MGVLYKLLEIALLCSILGLVVAMYLQQNKSSDNNGESFGFGSIAGAVQGVANQTHDTVTGGLQAVSN